MLPPTESSFVVIPALDLRGGRVVRLRHGDFAQEDVYWDDPVAAASRFAAAGARWLHVVDLDGARAGEPRHSVVIARIVAATGDRMRCEVGGGLRSEASVGSALAAGAQRAVLGTSALRDPAMIGRLVARYGTERLAAAIDVRDGLALGDAWQTGAGGVPMVEAIAQLLDVGVATFEVTAIDRDGALAGPDLDLLASAVASGAEVIASAGIRTVADLRAIRGIGCTGAIVGRALYDGSLDLEEAMAAMA